MASVRYIRVPTSSGRRIYIKRYPCFTVSLFLQASTQRIMPASGHLVAQITPAKRTGTGGFITVPALQRPPPLHPPSCVKFLLQSLREFFRGQILGFCIDLSISFRSLEYDVFFSPPPPLPSRKINSSDRWDYDSISSTESDHWRTSNFRLQFPSSGSADERGLYPIWKPKHVPGTCHILRFLFFFSPLPSPSSVV